MGDEKIEYNDISKNPIYSKVYVLAMMKNEGDILREWINHYILFGADKIFLIDDGSSDDSCDIASSYAGYVTLYNATDLPVERGRQVIAYNKYFGHLIGQDSWALICDIDEFIFPVKTNTFQETLSEFKCGQISMAAYQFGFIPNKLQPTSIIGSNRLRFNEVVEILIKDNIGKWLMKSFFKLNALTTFNNVHKQKINGNNISANTDILRYNHYFTQSEEHIIKRLMRGGGDLYRLPVSKEEAENKLATTDWSIYHEIEDTTLIDIYEKRKNIADNIYIIHMSKAVERAHLVKKIVDLTGAKVFEAIINEENGNAGCTASHTEVMKLVPKGEDLLIFEDDCEIIDSSFIQNIKQEKANYDVMYIGTNKTFTKDNMAYASWGTHAMWISKKAIELFLEFNEKTIPQDHIWNKIEAQYNLKVWRPDPINKYLQAALNLKSYITARILTSEVVISKLNCINPFGANITADKLPNNKILSYLGNLKRAGELLSIKNKKLIRLQDNEMRIALNTLYAKYPSIDPNQIHADLNTLITPIQKMAEFEPEPIIKEEVSIIIPVYKKPTRSDMAILLVYYNACEYKRLAQNLTLTYQTLVRSGIPVFLVEHCFKDQVPLFPENGTTIFNTKSDSYMFYKENLINWLMPKVPEQYTKFYMMDADLLFEKDTWYDDISVLLDTNDIIQPFQDVIRLDSDLKTINNRGISSVYNYINNIEGFGFPGFVWAARRDFIQPNGLFDLCIIGSGDCFLSTIVVGYDITDIECRKSMPWISPLYTEYCKLFSNIRATYYLQTIYHLWHGSNVNRRHDNRYTAIQSTITKYNIQTKDEMFELNSYGLYEYKSEYRDEFNEILLNYFKGRNEDGI